MKIGVLTFHRTTNFGSYLQTYGLYKKICDLGYDCEVIDYRCPAIEERENLNNHKVRWTVKGIARELLIQPAINQKSESLLEFSAKNMKISKPYYPFDIKKAADSYDKIFVGSDIVWGVDITENDWNYFLEFVEDDKKKFAFSSSFGSYNHSENDGHIKELLQLFSDIAVRENDAVDWVREIAERESRWVCDPTMLLTTEEWNDAIHPTDLPFSNYILVYFDSNGKCIRDAQKIAKKNGWKVCYINYALPFIGVNNIKPKSLSEFLGLIRNAKMIYTASYHGMLFSIYYEKPFYFYTRAHSSRVLSLANKLGVTDRCGDNCIEFFESQNYTTVNDLVMAFRKYSIDVLKEMLEA